MVYQECKRKSLNINKLENLLLLLKNKEFKLPPQIIYMTSFLEVLHVVQTLYFQILNLRLRIDCVALCKFLLQRLN